MSGGQMMVVLIVTIVMIASVIKARYGHMHRRGQLTGGRGGDGASETERLRKEVVNLKDRIVVLERIATDKESSLEREIELLRDR